MRDAKFCPDRQRSEQYEEQKQVGGLKRWADLRKEGTVQRTYQATVQDCARAALALLALFLAMMPSAVAENKSKPAEQPAAVIAHLPLLGGPVSEMFLQERGSKRYLYIEQASNQGFTIIDVTKPKKPNVLKREAWPKGASAGKLRLIGGEMALAEAPDWDSGTVGRGSRTESVTVLDLSDPVNPRTILSFAKVTSVLTDDRRNLIYVTNNEGLWILRHRQEQPESHPCSSEATMIPNPNCE